MNEDVESGTDFQLGNYTAHMKQFRTTFLCAGNTFLDASLITTKTAKMSF